MRAQVDCLNVVLSTARCSRLWTRRGDKKGGGTSIEVI